MNVKTVAFLLSLSLLSNCSNGQKNDFASFVSSFEKTNNSDFIDFRMLSKFEAKMSVREALAFVYHGDSSQLFCLQKIVNLDNEHERKIIKSLKLPARCLFIKYSNFFLIGYTSYKCNNPNVPRQKELILKIVDYTYSTRDSLNVHLENEFGVLKSGIFNPQKKVLFLTGEISKNVTRAILYEIDTQQLIFKTKYSKESIPHSLSKMKEDLEALGWSKEFY
jgi:hypothetical protein